MRDVVYDYWAVWKQFVLQGVMQEDVLPPALGQSWRRCAASGLDPYGPPPAGRQDSRTSTDASERTGALDSAFSPVLLTLVRPAMEDLHQFAEGSECVVVFADAEARIVDIVGAQSIRDELEHIGLARAMSWREEERGANALALALQESFPMQLDGAMHFCAFLHPVYTSAAPVHDLFGQAIGVLGVIGRHEQPHPHTLGMITAAAQALSNQLQMQVWLSNANDRLTELKTILQTLSEGILLLRYDGVISQMNTPAGSMLGLSPARVTGRRLRDVLPLPTALVQAMEARQPLSYEEIVFDTAHGRVTCLCTLKPITSHRLETGLEGIMSSTRLMISDSLAADRTNSRVMSLFGELEPSVVRLIGLGARAGARAGKTVALCGELAANPRAAPLLAGLGIRELSMSPPAVPAVKAALHRRSIGHWQKQAERLLAAGTAQEVQLVLRATGEEGEARR